MRRFHNAYFFFDPGIFTKIFFSHFRHCFQHIQMMSCFRLIIFQHIKLHEHFIAINRSICFFCYCIITNIKNKAVIINGIICFPEISISFFSFSYFLQKSGPGYNQSLWNGNDHICSFIRFIRRMVFTWKKYLSPGGFGCYCHPGRAE